MFSRSLLFAGCLALASSAGAYTFTGSTWSTSTITMQLQLGASPGTLLDGSTSWGAVAENALSTWNAQIHATQFTVVRDSTAPIAQGNGKNNVFFSPNVYGDAWGTGVLAVTLTMYTGGTQTTECDVLFNQNLSWNSYRGNLRYGTSGAIYDFRRVAMHEFGHVLGLDHPDQAGQTVTALMNSRISNLDTLASDDIAGAQDLYGVNTTTTPVVTTPPPTTPPPPTTVAPTISTQPANQMIVAGQSATFSVAASGTPAPTFQWYKDGVALAGATATTYTLAAVQSANSGTYTVRVSNSAGAVLSSPAVLTIATPPVVAAAPVARTINAGDQLTLAVTATGNPAPSYQWQKNGVNIAGATQSTYVISASAPGDAGTYDVVLTNAAGSLTTVPVLVTVNYSQLVNLSARGYVPAGGALTAGFVLRGTGDKSVLVRGVGPALNSYGVANALPDPQLALIAQSTSQTLAVNDRWDSTPQLSTQFQNLGAFPLPTGSADSASEIQLQPGNYTSRVAADTATTTGVALAEVYDADPTSARVRLVNLSTRGFTGPGDHTLIAGFAVDGNAPKHVLIRAIGPGLVSYGVTDTLADPRLDVYKSGAASPFAGNDNWGGSLDLQNVFTASGAFPVATDSRDAAIVLTLDPGSYTVLVSGVGNTSGNVLVEVYDLDP